MRDRVGAARREARGRGGIKEKSGEIFNSRGGGEKRLKKRVGGWIATAEVEKRVGVPHQQNISCHEVKCLI